MDYVNWERTLPLALTGDALWRQQAYRLSTFAVHASWSDVSKLAKDRRTVGVASQLFRAIGSVGANIAEGYSRGTGADRTRLYEYALGSAREARHWYCGVGQVVGPSVVAERSDLLARIIRLVLVTLPHERHRAVRRGGH